jgi:hypothetical protein
MDLILTRRCRPFWTSCSEIFDLPARLGAAAVCHSAAAPDMGLRAPCAVICDAMTSAAFLRR